MSVRDEITQRLQRTFEGAIEKRARELHADGYTKDDLSIRYDRNRTCIFVLDEIDSEFWIEGGDGTITVRGESRRAT